MVKLRMFSFEKIHEDGSARSGIIHTPHGDIQTPAFIPVATKAAVRTLTPQELRDAGSQAVLANTYHLYLSPGTDVLTSFGGFAPFMKWNGPTFTDSGGYQVSFLWNPKDNSSGQSIVPLEKENRAASVKISEQGATFKSHIDGSEHLLTPERSMEIQSALGADVIMAFDQPLSSSFSQRRQEEAFSRTLRWEERSYIRWSEIQKNRENFQALYGVVQGETDATLRKKSMEFILSMNFPGIAIGGASIGSNPQITAEALDTIVELIPADKPVHALGLGGGVEGVLEAVARNVDTFDNTSITRMARTGIVFISPKDGGTKENKHRMNVHKFGIDDKEPISKDCRCFTCQNFSRSYLRHLQSSGEILGGRLASIHNIYFMNNLMSEIRTALKNKNFQAFYEDMLQRKLKFN